MTGRVWVVGSLNVDLVCSVDRHPVPGETRMGRDLVRVPGGKGANQAVAAAQAGAPVTLVGAVGDDEPGRAYLAALADRGVDTRVRTVSGRVTGCAIVTVDANGENAIVVVPGANAALTADDVRASLAGVAAGDVLLVQLEVPVPAVTAAAEAAKAAEATVLLNPSPWQALPPDLLAVVDVLVTNEAEAAAAGELPSSVSVLRTLGDRGAQWQGHVVAAEPVDVVDTTGAGDAFAGALAASLAAGRLPEAALRAAVRAGARACTHSGAQSWPLLPPV